MTIRESLAEAKARRAVIIDRISMGEAKEIEAQAAALRRILSLIGVGLICIGIMNRVRRNGI